MGVKNLYAVIKKHAPAAISSITMADLADKVVAVDASIVIYQWCTVGQRLGIVNKNGKYINHIQGAFHRTMRMLAAGIVPVFVFDGRPPDSKTAKLEERRRRRATQTAGRHITISAQVYDEVRKLLQLMGVPVIMAPAEADAQIGRMVAEGVADYAATEDSDMLLYGAKILRGLVAGADSFDMIDPAVVMRELGISDEQFLDFCILLGTDYTSTIPGIGPARALKLIKEHNSIEGILAAESITPPPGFDHAAARRAFLQHVTYDCAREHMKLRRLSADDIATLNSFLVDIHGLAPQRVTKGLAELQKIMNQRAS